MPFIRYDAVHTSQAGREALSRNQAPVAVADICSGTLVEPSHAAEHTLVSTMLCHARVTRRAAVQALWFHVQLPMASLGLAAGVAAQASARRLRGAPLLNLLHQRAAAAAGAPEPAPLDTVCAFELAASPEPQMKRRVVTALFAQKEWVQCIECNLLEA